MKNAKAANKGKKKTVIKDGKCGNNRNEIVLVPIVPHGTMTVWRIGSIDRPANGDDVLDFKQKLEDAKKKLENGGHVDFVTHHAVDFINVNL